MDHVDKDYTGADTKEIIYKLTSEFAGRGNVNCRIRTFSSVLQAGPSGWEFRETEITCGHQQIELILSWAGRSGFGAGERVDRRRSRNDSLNVLDVCRKRVSEMKLMRILALVFVAVLACKAARSADKKYMTVHAGNSTRQVNNHPWSITTPGQADTNCSTNGTIDATGSTTDIDGTVRANTDCSTTYRPPRTTTGNRITVDNASWVTDTASGDQYQIECTAHWVASKCSFLRDGDYKAVLEGNNLWVTGLKGMKESTAKYHVLQYVPGRHTSPAPVAATAASADWSEGEKST